MVSRMPRIDVQAGADLRLDLLGPDDLDRGLQRLGRTIAPRSTTLDVAVLVDVGAAGTFSDELVWDCPLGMTGQLVRAGLSAAGFNAGAPLAAAAGGWAELHVGDFGGPEKVVATFPAQPGSGAAVAPAVQAWGGYDGKVLRSGQQLRASGAAPAGTELQVYVQFRLVQGIARGDDT